MTLHEEILEDSLNTKGDYSQSPSNPRVFKERPHTVQHPVRWRVTKLADSGGQVMSEELRRYHACQSLASSRIEGFEPDEAFLADLELVIQNRITSEDAIFRCIERYAPQTRAHERHRIGETLLNPLSARAP